MKIVQIKNTSRTLIFEKIIILSDSSQCLKSENYRRGVIMCSSTNNVVLCIHLINQLRISIKIFLKRSVGYDFRARLLLLSDTDFTFLPSFECLIYLPSRGVRVSAHIILWTSLYTANLLLKIPFCLCSVANPSRNGTRSRCTYWPTSRVSETASQYWTLVFQQSVFQKHGCNRIVWSAIWARICLLESSLVILCDVSNDDIITVTNLWMCMCQVQVWILRLHLWQQEAAAQPSAVPHKRSALQVWLL